MKSNVILKNYDLNNFSVEICELLNIDCPVQFNETTNQIYRLPCDHGYCGNQTIFELGLVRDLNIGIETDSSLPRCYRFSQDFNLFPDQSAVSKNVTNQISRRYHVQSDSLMVFRKIEGFVSLFLTLFSVCYLIFRKSSKNGQNISWFPTRLGAFLIERAYFNLAFTFFLTSIFNILSTDLSNSIWPKYRQYLQNPEKGLVIVYFELALMILHLIVIYQVYFLVVFKSMINRNWSNLKKFLSVSAWWSTILLISWPYLLTIIVVILFKYTNEFNSILAIQSLINIRKQEDTFTYFGFDYHQCYLEGPVLYYVDKNNIFVKWLMSISFLVLVGIIIVYYVFVVSSFIFNFFRKLHRRRFSDTIGIKDCSFIVNPEFEIEPSTKKPTDESKKIDRNDSLDSDVMTRTASPVQPKIGYMLQPEKCEEKTTAPENPPKSEQSDESTYEQPNVTRKMPIQKPNLVKFKSIVSDKVLNETKRPSEVLRKSNVNGGRRNTLFNLGPRPSLYTIAQNLPTNTKKRESQLLSMTPYFQETLRRTYDKRQKINEFRRSSKILHRENLNPENTISRELTLKPYRLFAHFIFFIFNYLFYLLPRIFQNIKSVTNSAILPHAWLHVIGRFGQSWFIFAIVCDRWVLDAFVWIVRRCRKVRKEYRVRKCVKVRSSVKKIRDDQ